MVTITVMLHKQMLSSKADQFLLARHGAYLTDLSNQKEYKKIQTTVWWFYDKLRHVERFFWAWSCSMLKRQENYWWIEPVSLRYYFFKLYGIGDWSMFARVNDKMIQIKGRNILIYKSMYRTQLITTEYNRSRSQFQKPRTWSKYV